MKRSQITAILAVIACLAAGSATMVFGQLNGGVQIPPPPMPAGPPQVEVIQPPAPQVPLPPDKFGPVVPPPLPQTGPVQPAPSFPIRGTQPAVPMPTPAQTPPAMLSGPPGLPGQVILQDKGPKVGGTERAEPTADITGPTASADNPTGRQEPAVSIEWVGPASARLNQPTSYQIIAKSICNMPVHNVTVRYKMPAGARVIGSDPPGLNETSQMTWELGTLMPAQEKRIDLQIMPEAKAELTCQASVTFTGSSTFRVQVREPKLFLKAMAPDRVVQGDTATVAMTVTNPGDGSADHVKIKALLPEGLEHARGKLIELDLGNLSPGESRTVQLVCLAKAAGSQLVDCVALADAGLNAQDTAKLDVVLPRLDLNVAGPKLRYIDRHAIYVLKVTNPGSARASNVTISHLLPQGFKFHAASGGGRHDFTSRTVSWFVGDLTPGESREVSLEVIATNIGEHHHRTVATAARGLKTESEVITRVEGLSALLMELVDTEDPIEVGAETSYEIRVTNTGSKTETNLELVCTIPEKMEFRGAKCAAGCRYRVEGKDVIFEVLPRLAPRADVLYRVVVRGIAPGDMRFRARIRADGLSEPVLREESTKVYGDESLPK